MQYVLFRSLRRAGAFALVALSAIGLAPAHAAIQGVLGPGFDLTAAETFSSQPDGAQIYSWGYGCTSNTAPLQVWPQAAGNTMQHGPAPRCPGAQLPGPTLIVTEGDTVTVTLTNHLPPAAGKTSIVFSGFQVCAGTLVGAGPGSPGTCTPLSGNGTPGLLAQEAATNQKVTYSFYAGRPGTFAYHSGSETDLQIEMGLYGAIVVKPKSAPANCRPLGATASGNSLETDSRLAPAAYNQADTCYDREYLFQFAEMNSRVHDEVQEQVRACAIAPCPPMQATMEPYRPNYYLINGRSMPDLMDASYVPTYPNQPYNANPHMHPGERLLMRVIGQGRWQHPFHFHGNHARVLARDGNLLLSAADNTSLAGPLLFTIPTVSGQTVDAIFSWSGKGLNWDVYNHAAGDGSRCVPDASGFHSIKTDPNYGEWCADHGKPIPVTPPDPQIVANGQWYGGTPYLGLSGFNAVNLPPGTLNQNPSAGYAYMWHSHNEREITTNDVFPGGMMMMLIIDAPQWPIDETL